MLGLVCSIALCNNTEITDNLESHFDVIQGHQFYHCIYGTLICSVVVFIFFVTGLRYLAHTKNIVVS